MTLALDSTLNLTLLIIVNQPNAYLYYYISGPLSYVAGSPHSFSCWLLSSSCC